MQITIRHTGGEEPRFTVDCGREPTRAVTLNPPIEVPVKGFPKKRLADSLQWYLEEYLDYPAGQEAKKAEAVVETLREWGTETFSALFTGKAYGWYEQLLRDLKAGEPCQVQVVSDSAAVLSWPWEALRDDHGSFPAQLCPLVRQPLDLPSPDWEDPGRADAIHMLMIVARPYGERDVSFHSLARTVVDYAVGEKNPTPVEIEVLRPPTFDALRDKLSERPGYYHIVHFDGHGSYTPSQAGDESTGGDGKLSGGGDGRHKDNGLPDIGYAPGRYQGQGSLVFEKPDGSPDPIDAEKLGQLLQQHRIPMMALNACQSAMVDGKDPYSSVAASLLRAGVPSVTAMGYSLWVSGAQVFVPAFYKQLFQDGVPGGAMVRGRQEMYRDRVRAGSFGRAELRDWIVPELYQRTESGARVLPEIEPGGTYQERAAARRDALPEEVRDLGDYGFFVRGDAIQELERIFQRNQQAGVLIHGMAGAGKTTLAKGFLHWLSDTCGLREPDGTDCPVFWFDFREVFSAEHIVNDLASAFLGPESRTMNAEARLSALTACLRRRRAVIVWDNFESASGVPGTEVTANLSEADFQILKRFLRALRGEEDDVPKTRVLITSRTTEETLSIQECARTAGTLDGLRDDELWTYCDRIARDLGVKLNHEDPDLIDLLKKLDGNPLAVRAMILQLGKRTAGDLRRALDEAGRGFDGAEGDESTRRILASFRVLRSGIGAEDVPVMQALGLHEHYADLDYIASIVANVLGIQAQSPEGQKLYSHVKDCFRLLEAAGFCADVGGSVYRLHPALRGCLSREYPPTEDVQRWFVRVMAFVEDQVHNDQGQRVALFSYYETNFFHAKTAAEELEMHEEDLGLTWGLANVAHDRSRFAQAETLYQEMAEKAHRYGDFDKENRAYDQLAVVASNQGDRERAKAWTQKAADMWNGREELSADAYYTLGDNAERQGDLQTAAMYYEKELAIREREGDYVQAGGTYGLLGGLAAKQEDDETAEKWYLKQWQTAKRISNPALQADASRELGRLAARRGDGKQALDRYLEALEIFRELKDPRNIAITLNDLGVLFRNAGMYKEAREYLLESVRTAERIGNAPLIAVNYYSLGVVAEYEGDYASARGWYTRALEMWEQMGDEGNAAIAQRNLADVEEAERGGG